MANVGTVSQSIPHFWGEHHKPGIFPTDVSNKKNLANKLLTRWVINTELLPPRGWGRTLKWMQILMNRARKWSWLQNQETSHVHAICVKWLTTFRGTQWEVVFWLPSSSSVCHSWGLLITKAVSQTEFSYLLLICPLLPQGILLESCFYLFLFMHRTKAIVVRSRPIKQA